MNKKDMKTLANKVIVITGASSGIGEAMAREFAAQGARVVLGLDDLLTAPVNGSGYNPQYGLLGSNKADDTRVKLFPRDADVTSGCLKAVRNGDIAEEQRGWHGYRVCHECPCK